MQQSVMNRKVWLVFLVITNILLPYGHLFAANIQFSNKDIQDRVINNTVVTIEKGLYYIDDSSSIIIPSNRRIIFKNGAIICFVNTKGEQFESVFEINGDNVCIEGLKFTSDSFISRQHYRNGARDGESSLCTIIRSYGNNITIRNITANNADIVISIAKGDNITIDNVKAKCFQPIYAQHCNNIRIKKVKTVLNAGSDRFDHHLYFKCDVNNIRITDCEFSGGRSFALQFSGDYSNLDICPRNIYVANVIMRNVSKGIVVDKGRCDVRVSKVKAYADTQPDSYFLSNRGGIVEIDNSVMTGFSRIELESIALDEESRGKSQFEKCDFFFTDDKSRAFELYYLDSLTVMNSNFLYQSSPRYDGCVLRTEKDRDAVGTIIMKKNNFVMNSNCNYLISVPTSKTSVSLEDCNFYNLNDNNPNLFHNIIHKNLSYNRIKVSNILTDIKCETEQNVSHKVMKRYKRQ